MSKPDELDNPADRAVITRIPMNEWRRLKRISKREGRSVAAQVRRLIHDYVNSTDGESQI